MKCYMFYTVLFTVLVSKFTTMGIVIDPESAASPELLIQQTFHWRATTLDVYKPRSQVNVTHIKFRGNDLWKKEEHEDEDLIEVDIYTADNNLFKFILVRTTGVNTIVHRFFRYNQEDNSVAECIDEDVARTAIPYLREQQEEGPIPHHGFINMLLYFFDVDLDSPVRPMDDYEFDI